MEDIKVKIGGKEYDYRAPDYATRYEMLLAVNENQIRGSAAILGCCLPGLVSAGYEAHHCNAMRFGAYVWEQILPLIEDDIEIVRLAMPIRMALLRAAFPAETEERTDFFSPSEATSTP